MKKYFIYSVSALAAIASSLASCSNEDEFGPAGAQRVELNVTANRGGDALSRTAFENVDGNLLCTWDEDDQLVAFNAAGTNLGVLTIKAETLNDAKTTATFSGNVTIADGETVRLYYVGNGATGLESLTSEGAIALGTQLGTIEDLAANDFLSSQAAVEFRGGKAVATVEMKREVAEGYFQLTMPEGVTLTAEDFVTISAESGILPVEATVNYSTATVTPATTTGEIKVNIAGEAANSFYVTMLPCNVAPKFVVRKDGKIYTATLASHDWIAGSFVRANSNGDPVNVSDWTVTTPPTDITDPDNWGSDRVEEIGNYTTSYWDFSETGRYTNHLDMRGWGGWATWIEYTNGIQSNLLTSNAGTAYYFQWGRIMGFPSNVLNEPDVLGGSLTPMSFGTAGDPGGYTSCYEAQYMSWTTTESNKYPYVFGGSTTNHSKAMDWCSTNNDCTWESRCGNPCPDGYRLPTAAEMAIFIPEEVDGTVNGSHAEVKVVNGEKVAMEWVVTAKNGNTPAYISVRMAKTDANTVKVGDDVFDSSKVIRLAAYGYLMNNGALSARGTSGIYWTSETGDAADLLDGVTGYGGQALYFEIDGTTANMLMGGVPRSFAGNVIPVKDASAKAVTYRPWFPYGDQCPVCNN